MNDSFSSARKCYISYVNGYVDAKTWKVLWKKEAKEKVIRATVGRAQTRAEKSGDPHCGLRSFVEWVEWTNQLVPEPQFPCPHSKGIGLEMHQSLGAVKISD